MEQSKENLLAVLRSRRTQNFKNQLKSVLLEGYEIFGKLVVEDVEDECKSIFDDYVTQFGSTEYCKSKVDE